MSGLRFAMVTTFYPPHHFGGDAVFIRRLVQALARRGHEVEVVHDVDAHDLLRRGPEPEPLEEPTGVRTHRLRSRSGGISNLLTQQLGRPIVHGRRIREILDRGAFDVIHFHNISLVGGPGVLAYGDAIKLYMAHEHWLVCPMHVLWRHNRELCTGRECFRCSLHFRRPPQLWRQTGLLERMIENVDAFISPSAFSAEKHREFGFQRDFEVIPYFLPDLDSGAESADSDGPSWERPYFLFVGRLQKIKGLQDLLPHFGPDSPADLLVVGTGDFEPELRELALQAGSNRVHWLGPRSPEALRPLYRDALAVLMPSICYETFGIVLLEAFRERTPVVARSLGPMPEIVNQSGGGFLFDGEADLAEALSRLAQDSELRNRMGEAGYRALCERWLESVVLRDYFALIRRIAAHRGQDRIVELLGSEQLPLDAGVGVKT